MTTPEEIAYLYKDEAYFKLLRMSRRKDIIIEYNKDIVVYKNFTIILNDDNTISVGFKEIRYESLFKSNRNINQIKLMIDLCLHINLPKIAVNDINIDGNILVDRYGKGLTSLEDTDRFITLYSDIFIINKSCCCIKEGRICYKKSPIYLKIKPYWQNVSDEFLIKAHNLFFAGAHKELDKFIKTLTYDRITKKELKQVKELTNDSFMEYLSKIRPLVYNQIKESSFDFSNLELLIAFCCDIKAIEYFNKHKK